MKQPGIRFYTLIIGASLLLVSTSVVAATPPKPGAVCAKVGLTQIYNNIKYSCIKDGKKLVWDKGVIAKKSAPTPSPSPSKSSNLRTYSVQMEKAYLPQAPALGWDDYRCFLLDPKVEQDSIIRSIQFIPENKDYVHHAIIFRVTASDLPSAIEKSKNEIGRAHV